MMEIISFNIWDLPLWFVRNRDIRMKAIAQYLVDRGTEIICLQESWSLKHRKILSDILKAHGYSDAVAIAGIGRKSGGLLTFSKFPITSVKFIPFGRRGAAISEIFGNKGALETIVQTPKGLLKVINTHLHYQSTTLVSTSAIRLRQLRLLLKATASELPTILAGDFNQHDMHNDASFNTVLGTQGFSDPAPQQSMPTYRKENPMVNNWINRVKVSHQYDYIMTRGIKKMGYSLYSYAPLYLEEALSDHDPVSMVLL